MEANGTPMSHGCSGDVFLGGKEHSQESQPTAFCDSAIMLTLGVYGRLLKPGEEKNYH